MSLKHHYLRILSALLPAGTLGMSLLVGAAAPADANLHPTRLQPAAAHSTGVAKRLASVRDAVSDLVPTAQQDGTEEQLAWGNWHNWRNGGWRNWRNGWHNGGWGNWWRNW